MKTRMLLTNLFATCACLLGTPAAHAVTNIFFNASQTATLVVSNINAVTISSGDYLFTYSADGYWSSGGGTPTGRFFGVLWPDGVQAQALRRRASFHRKQLAHAALQHAAGHG